MRNRHSTMIADIIESDVIIEIKNLIKINHSDHHSKNRFRIFSYRWKIFLACHQIHTKMTLNDDCTKMIYREKRTRRLHFDQVLDFDSSFSLSSRRLRSENRFRIFSYRWKNFLACHQIHTKMTFNADRRYFRKWCDDRDQKKKAMMSHFKKRWVFISILI
jgi:hypothetical protein